MFFLSCEEVLKATGGTLVSGGIEANITGISTDSRKIKVGDLFIPLIGERFDGHEYIQTAFDAGASFTLTQKEISCMNGKTVIRVGDTSMALRDLAAFYRQKFSIPFVGITGSVGKTSTKDMIACVLEQKFNILKTEGNLNNEIGVPLTVFNLDKRHEAAVLEMGMSGFGEISRLAAIVKPDIAVITNIGLSHIEKLGSRQNILKAKLEILEGLNDSGLVVLNGDDDLLDGVEKNLEYRTVYYGTKDGADYQACNINSLGENGIHFEVAVDAEVFHVHVPVPGIHNVHNALAAMAVGREMDIPMEEIIKGISRFSPGKMRLNITTVNGLKVINDVYNASPQSMEAAINVLMEIGSSGRRVAVLGDMLEMGGWAEKAHKDVGRYAAEKRVDLIVTVGPNARYIAGGASEAGYDSGHIASFDDNSEAVDFLKRIVKNGDVVLVKGSRGMKMESIVDGIAVDNR